MSENLFVELTAGGDASLSEQFLSTFRRGEPWEPEKALLIAILTDAIHDYRKYSRARNRDGQARFRDADRWIMGGDNQWVFSFKNVCELLGLDPDYIRRGVRAAAVTNPVGRKLRQRHRARRGVAA
jgi:hypothetical protein